MSLPRLPHAMRIAFALCWALLPLLANAQVSRQIEVRLDAAAMQPTASGRLLVFAMPADKAETAAKDGKVESVNTSAMAPAAVNVAAMEVPFLASGASVMLDADAIAFPRPFSQLPIGDYYLQAVLDSNHDYNYGGRGAGDIVSEPTKVRLGKSSRIPSLALTRVLPDRPDPWLLSDDAPDDERASMAASRAQTQPLDFISPALSAFWGREIHMHGWVVLPPGYGDAANAAARYPTVYYTHGYGGNLPGLARTAASIAAAMRNGSMPPMFWVLLDESSATGTHEFADSVNNGPWGQAFTTELIPSLEARYRMDGKASGRFLNGHSSGGWATLWLQVTYPKVFGGTWSTAPDPSDFHDFTGADIYAPSANVYRKPDGSAWPLVRMNGEVVSTLEQYARQEAVQGEYGGQMSSFDWVFSPRGSDGRPMPMFDRATGKVDPEVAAYWREHYDIVHTLKAQWPMLKPDLDSKIHVIVGDADTFYLDGAAHLLKDALDGLGAKSEVRFLPGKTHMDLYAEGDDRRALLKQIAWQMYAAARPGSKRPAPVEKSD
ncbi:MAG: alpha/beta hydrolase-fold protein [Thermomonas sp.]